MQPARIIAVVSLVTLFTPSKLTTIARISISPVRVCTIDAPKGRGCGVPRERPVKAISAFMRSASPCSEFLIDVLDLLRVRAAAAPTPISELSTRAQRKPRQNAGLLYGLYALGASRTCSA